MKIIGYLAYPFLWVIGRILVGMIVLLYWSTFSLLWVFLAALAIWLFVDPRRAAIGICLLVGIWICDRDSPSRDNEPPNIIY